MKKALLFVLVSWAGMHLASAALEWTTDLQAAKSKAQEQNKLVLMNFTGSDWCGWCKKLKAEVFSKDEFADYAKKNLVLVELDFPNKIQQSEELKQANKKLKSEFGVRGYPTIVVLDAKGKEVWKQVGYMKGGPEAFIGEIEKAKAGK